MHHPRIVDNDVFRWAGVGDLRARLAAIFGGKMLVAIRDRLGRGWANAWETACTPSEASQE